MNSVSKIVLGYFSKKRENLKESPGELPDGSRTTSPSPLRNSPDYNGSGIHPAGRKN